MTDVLGGEGSPANADRRLAGCVGRKAAELTGVLSTRLHASDVGGEELDAVWVEVAPRGRKDASIVTALDRGKASALDRWARTPMLVECKRED